MPKIPFNKLNKSSNLVLKFIIAKQGKNKFT